MKRFLSVLLLLFSFSLYAQETLGMTNTSWTNVIPGKVISEPALTSYGFCLITDAQQISAFTNKGKTLWEKNLERSRDALVSTLTDDFFIVVSHGGQRITLLNPSGCELWKTDLDFQIIDKPFSGRDGRFFTRGINTLCCFGMNGVCRWKLETPLQSSLPPQQLNDGSLVIFLKDLLGEKTQGLRVSPFGELLEEITFSGEVLSVNSCNAGVLLNFRDGTSGLFSVIENKAVNTWGLLISQQDKAQMETSFYAVSKDKSKVLFILPFAGSITVNEINQKNGSIISNFEISDFHGYNIKNYSINSNGIYLNDSTQACFYSFDGIELWRAKLPQNKGTDSWNYELFTQDNHFVMCKENWSLNAYLASQATTHKKAATAENRKYPDFIIPQADMFSLNYSGTLSSTFTDEAKVIALQTGNYGPKEIPWLSEMTGTCQQYLQALNTEDSQFTTQTSPFDLDTPGVNKMLYQLPFYTTVETAHYSALFIKKLENKSLLKTLFSSISLNGYDPDGEILEAIDECSRKLNQKDEGTIHYLCDCIYSICRFMGRPAFYSKGKDILSRYLSSGYSIKTRTYARETLKKIADLDF